MNYDLHVPSTYPGKIAGAEQAVTDYHQAHLPEELIAITMGHESRDIFITKTTDRAMQQLPPRRVS